MEPPSKPRDMTQRLHAPREPEIRQALKGWLAARLPDAAVIDELGIKHGKFRVDICAITDTLHGYEIKSDQDTLARLPAQAKHFSLVFHRLTLVVGPALLGPALALVPPWWGILLVTVGEDGRPRVAELRDPGPNPGPNHRWVARLLWRDEIAACLRAAGVRGYARLRYAEIANRMLEVFTPDELRVRVAAALRIRKAGLAPVGSAAVPAPVVAVPAVAAPVPTWPARPMPARLAPPPDPEPSLQWLIMGLGAPPARG